MRRRVPDLEPGEECRGVAGASFRGALSATLRATAAFGSSRIRQRAFDEWQFGAESVGFPTAGTEMVLAVTDRRLLVYFTTFWAERPSHLAGAIDLDGIAQVAVARHGLVVGLAVALSSGEFVEFEAMRGFRLRRFGHALREVLAERRP